jgi:hypothetical protein
VRAHAVSLAREVLGQGKSTGQSLAPDDQIAEWCAKTEYVLVTLNSQDFAGYGRWVRNGLLAKHGVEVIVYDRDIKGLQEQHRRLTANLERWTQALETFPYGHRVWDQGLRGPPKQVVGARRKRGARNPAPPDAPIRPEGSRSVPPRGRQVRNTG